MSRSAWIRKLKIVAVLGFIVAALFTVRLLLVKQGEIGLPQDTGAQSNHEPVTNDRLKRVEGAGLVRMAENARLALAVDLKDGSIEVLDKEGGHVWRSKPTKEAVEKDGSNNLWKNNLQSPLIVEYVKSYTETVPTYANAFTPNTKVSVFEMTGGARVYYEFEGLGIRMAIDYYLHEDHLEVEVPDYMVEEPKDEYVTDEQGKKTLDSGNFRKIVGYSVLPFFGAVQAGASDGYLLVPDGPGGLIKFEKNQAHKLNFTGTVYGHDLSYANAFDSSLNSQREQATVFYPAFGLNNGGRSMLGIIHSGESGAEIIGNPAGAGTSFYNAYARFKFREKYKKLTDLTGAGVFLYADFSVNVTRNIRYYLLTGDHSDYSGMAQAYRSYLMKEKGLTKKPKKEGDMPLELHITGGAEKTGFLSSSFIPMTTFGQAGEMVDYFKQNGISNMTVIYKGWASGGTSVPYPNRFPAASRLGGTKGLQRFIEQAQSYGYKVLLEDDHMRALTGKGISERKDVVRNIQNAPLDIGEWDSQQVLNASAVKRYLEDSLPEYAKLEVDGIQERGFNILNSDFQSSAPMNREQVKMYYKDVISSMVEDLGSVRVKNGMAYQLMNGVSIENVASEYSFSPIIDEIVPFYPMALHGLADYVSVPYNQMDEPKQEMLKAIEYGANVSFAVTAEKTELLKDAKINDLYSSAFPLWKEDILKLYKKVNEALGGVSGSFITGHGQLAPDVYRTSYENGTEIVCNYSDAPYAYEGKTVAAKDFIVIKGSDGP
ncbi:DUF5696 domain-containing protein [Paenibacillus spongiae]|uniref:DUF5696 domain-containing protein n=1 Tax=Paenibacillus spongiae TaxID=2909671 RepID=A0ABY5S6I9_9BACL|nr:DUF5696 domain-containing protein [Paenibacillus spongiae]UVI29526.1 DUF5696 domain-containing protein [Paenibacillus spongiae]